MPLLQRLAWIEQQIQTGSSLYVTIGAAQKRGTIKVKFVLCDHSWPNHNIHSFLAVAQMVKGLCRNSHVVDKGHHSHTHNRSEVVFWITPHAQDVTTNMESSGDAMPQYNTAITHALASRDVLPPVPPPMLNVHDEFASVNVKLMGIEQKVDEMRQQVEASYCYAHCMYGSVQDLSNRCDASMSAQLVIDAQNTTIQAFRTCAKRDSDMMASLDNLTAVVQDLDRGLAEYGKVSRTGHLELNAELEAKFAALRGYIHNAFNTLDLNNTSWKQFAHTHVAIQKAQNVVCNKVLEVLDCVVKLRDQHDLIWNDFGDCSMHSLDEKITIMKTEILGHVSLRLDATVVDVLQGVAGLFEVRPRWANDTKPAGVDATSQCHVPIITRTRGVQALPLCMEVAVGCDLLSDSDSNTSDEDPESEPLGETDSIVSISSGSQSEQVSAEQCIDSLVELHWHGDFKIFRVTELFRKGSTDIVVAFDLEGAYYQFEAPFLECNFIRFVMDIP